MKIGLHIMMLGVAPLFAACSGGSDQPGSGQAMRVDADTAAAAAEPGDTLPASGRPSNRRVNLRVAGMEQPMVLRLYRSPPGFPVPFSTYIPQDVRVQTMSSGEGDGFRFVADYGPGQTDSAAVYVFFYPERTTDDAAREITRTVAESRGPLLPRAEIEPVARYPWSIVEYRIEPGGTHPVAGHVVLGRHAGRFFYVAVIYPVEMGDGFVPRARQILDAWRWGDTGERLGEDTP